MLLRLNNLADTFDGPNTHPISFNITAYLQQIGPLKPFKIEEVNLDGLQKTEHTVWKTLEPTFLNLGFSEADASLKDGVIHVGAQNIRCFLILFE